MEIVQVGVACSLRGAPHPALQRHFLRRCRSRRTSDFPILSKSSEASALVPSPCRCPCTSASQSSSSSSFPSPFSSASAPVLSSYPGASRASSPRRCSPAVARPSALSTLPSGRPSASLCSSTWSASHFLVRSAPLVENPTTCSSANRRIPDPRQIAGVGLCTRQLPSVSVSPVAFSVFFFRFLTPDSLSLFTPGPSASRSTALLSVRRPAATLPRQPQPSSSASSTPRLSVRARSSSPRPLSAICLGHPPLPQARARLCERALSSYSSGAGSRPASSLASGDARRSRKVHLVDDPDDCDAILDEVFFRPASSALLPASPLTTYLVVQRQIAASQSPFLTGDLSRQVVALDCEGVALGRFGRVCTVQLATASHTLLLDAFKTGIVGENPKLKEILESPHIVKVCHDCREDASALFHQHGIRLRNVFDTQVAHQVLCERDGEAPFQASLTELLRSFLNLRDHGVSAQAKRAMEADPSVWCGRPLSTDLLRYAVFGVSHLLDLAHVLAFHLGSCTEVVRRSCRKYLPYRHLNTHLNSPAEISATGAIIQGMVAARTCAGLTFKLNCGRNGVVSTPAALSRFHDVNLGDIVDVQVAGQSQDGQIVYLDRYDGLYNYWSLKERPRTRHKTGMALTSESEVDPLLLLAPDEEETQ
ncbi:3'-5' exonuclease domain-containing protein [Besnoitia besnoiti]|uniref:3'-5' exonuclease domain-containing protein n=1 Tax=Besnoitia besnoiti TaxID=94643 RepID=A0A2A9MNT4_BESBE|nr:3'-5' exonuclease domain-containing protein [Besnoitia besnoiti]PFH37372.1 3'-5' exonuclease domain-containing protein [Besnoitia besnoiti]